MGWKAMHALMIAAFVSFWCHVAAGIMRAGIDGMALVTICSR
jgi:hypothetical protein